MILVWSLVQKLRKLVTVKSSQSDTQEIYRTMEKTKTFYLGQIVESIPRYDLGTRSVGPTLRNSFKGVGLIVEIEWPDKAFVMTAEGEVLCLNTSRLMPITKNGKSKKAH
tara:strand:- start:9 stop:338 length:330 start_codon:yes stop_codon:yes gene_type:complete